jgi:hypothetical protein
MPYLDVSSLHSKCPYFPSYVFDPTSVSEKLRNIVDFVFLDGYYEPTVAFLHDEQQSLTAYVEIITKVT